VIGRYRALARRITDELSQLERSVSAAQRHWQAASTAADEEAYLNSVALNLHAHYSGLERLFELVAEEFDGGALGGANWHAELLRQMTLDMDDVRPPVLRRDTAEGLEDLRKFRHLIRNIYATNIDPDRLAPIIERLPALWRRVQDDLEAFSRFLDRLAES
jgi:hypothetical protein